MIPLLTLHFQLVLKKIKIEEVNKEDEITEKKKKSQD